mmetsp:Transcript_29730/g.83804  ORF Transcript_29730/g.83804 Transcript_29730/m.83804 type:complete len:119 (-) Transcript_29730:92-448(-)
MGRDESKEQAKAAQREKEQAAFEKKQAVREKQWEKGAKDTSKQESAAAKEAEAKARKAESKAQEVAEVGTSSQPPPTKRCKDCGHQMTPKEQKKGCPKCIEILLSGGAPAKGKGKGKK